MAGLHVPTIHFHIGAWAITTLSIALAFWINFLDKRGLLPEFIMNFLGDEIVEKLDYMALMTCIVGFSGILVSIWTGLIDANGGSLLNYGDINLLVSGYEKAISSPILGFKVVWAFTGMQFFILILAIRIYFVTIRKEKTVFDQNIFVQLIYGESALAGLFIMLCIAGAGGIYTTGSSIFSTIPILQDFLPGGNLMIPFFFFCGIFSVILALSLFIKEKNENFERRIYTN